MSSKDQLLNSFNQILNSHQTLNTQHTDNSIVNLDLHNTSEVYNKARANFKDLD